MKPIIVNNQTRRMLMGGQIAPKKPSVEIGVVKTVAKVPPKKAVIAKKKGRIYKKVNKK